MELEKRNIYLNSVSIEHNGIKDGGLFILMYYEGKAAKLACRFKGSDINCIHI